MHCADRDMVPPHLLDLWQGENGLTVWKFCDLVISCFFFLVFLFIFLVLNIKETQKPLFSYFFKLCVPFILRTKFMFKIMN